MTGWLSPDGSMILAVTNDDGGSRLAAARRGRRPAARDTAARRGLVGDFALPEPSLVAGRGVGGAVPGRRRMPGDVLAWTSPPARYRTLTNSLAALPGYALAGPPRTGSPPRTASWCRVYVYRSDNPADPALAGSAVLVIHGGPESQARRNFNPIVQRAGRGRAHRAGAERARLDRLRQALVLARRRGHAPRLGGGPRRDPRLPAQARTWTRLAPALWGGSYGGYMVLAGLAFQPELWAAGVDIVGISSLVTFLENTSAYRRAQREREYGQPGPRPRFPGLGVTADQDRRHPRAAVRHPRRQ